MADGIGFRVGLDDSALETLRASLSPAQMHRVMAVAITRTLKKGRTQFDKRIRSELNIQRKYTVGDNSEGPRIRIKPSDVHGEIVISGKPIPLIAYKPRKTKAGVFVQVKRGGPTDILKHAFIAEVNAGDTIHRGVFSRERHLPTKGKNKGRGKLTKAGYAGHLSIGEHYGPSLVSVFGAERLTAIGQEEISKLAETFKFEVAGQLSRNLGIAATEARGMLGVPESD